MKKILCPILYTLFFFGSINAQKNLAVRTSSEGKTTSADFEGYWKGGEKCQNISAPVATVHITPNGAEEVHITGLYSTTGGVIGLVKGGVITIPQQTVPDPIFKNLKIQGTLALSKNRQSLQALFIIFNNDARDDCSARYQRE